MFPANPELCMPATLLFSFIISSICGHHMHNTYLALVCCRLTLLQLVGCLWWRQCAALQLEGARTWLHCLHITLQMGREHVIITDIAFNTNVSMDTMFCA
jgi:hypothetical protein